jgi:hypothetical protein
MPDTNPDDDAFAQEAFARLEAIEPSASLLRRVAAIPIEAPRERNGNWWALWQAWPARWAILGALGLGALVGAVPLEDFATESATEVGLSSDDGELEDALAMAFGAERASTDALAEDFR